MSRTSAVVAALALAALAAVSAPPLVAPPPAVASAENAAGVVIDTGQGGEPKTVCVRFSEDSITGEELLRRANVDAVFAHHGSMGAAVCALCGTGCPAEDCFCESETRGVQWNYAHADDGGWRRAPRGASQHRLGDGDVDGWAWGRGDARPPYVPFETICDRPAHASPGATPAEGPSESDPPESPSPSSEPSGEPSDPPAGAVPPTADPGTQDPGGTDTAPPEPTPPPDPPAAAAPSPSGDTDPSPGRSPTATAAPAGNEQRSPAGARAGSTPTPAELLASEVGSRGGGGGLIVFGVLLAALSAAVVLRRRRRRPG